MKVKFVIFEVIMFHLFSEFLIIPSMDPLERNQKEPLSEI